MLHAAFATHLTCPPLNRRANTRSEYCKRHFPRYRKPTKRLMTFAVTLGRSWLTTHRWPILSQHTLDLFSLCAPLLVQGATVHSVARLSNTPYTVWTSTDDNGNAASHEVRHLRHSMQTAMLSTLKTATCSRGLVGANVRSETVSMTYIETRAVTDRSSGVDVCSLRRRSRGVRGRDARRRRVSSSRAPHLLGIQGRLRKAMGSARPSR